MDMIMFVDKSIYIIPTNDDSNILAPSRYYVRPMYLYTEIRRNRFRTYLA